MSSLTQEDLQRIDENRTKALEKLRKKNAETVADSNKEGGEATSEGASQRSKKRSRWATPFYEYNLSTMVDSKGGFIVEESTNEKADQLRAQTTVIEPFLQRSMDPAQNPKCKDCGSMDIDPIFLQVFHLYVCPLCKEKFPDKYSLITKTEVKEDYLLTDSELRDKELLPHWSKPNPRKSTWNNMMLYVREMVEEYAFKKWGGPEGLDEEFEKRETQKKEKKEKKFKEQLADLRRRTMTSAWERKRQAGPHIHTFDSLVEGDSGLTTQTCTGCGLVIESEEL